MTKEESRAIVAQVKENIAKLEACPRHNFVKIEAKMFSRYRCENCQGTVDSQAVYWYKMGIKHSTA